MRAILVVGLLMATLVGHAQRNTATGQSAAPVMPFVDVGACPFEGCVYRDWKVLKETTLYEYDPRNVMPGEQNRVLFTVRVNETITGMTGIVFIEKAGRARVKQPLELEARHPEFPRQPSEVVKIAPGDFVYLLTYNGEGDYTAWFNGRLGNLDTSCFSHPPGWTGFSRCAGRDAEILEEPVSRWWVQIRDGKGRIGWTDQPGNFGGKDRYGG